jgi:hypothetical protein
MTGFDPERPNPASPRFFPSVQPEARPAQGEPSRTGKTTLLYSMML